MTAQAIVAHLLEADPDMFDPSEEVERYSETMSFDEAVDDILIDARQLFARLVRSNVLTEIRDQGEPMVSIAGSRGYDPSAIVQAVMRLAIERRASLGAKNAYTQIRRHGHSIL